MAHASAFTSLLAATAGSRPDARRNHQLRPREFWKKPAEAGFVRGLSNAGLIANQDTVAEGPFPVALLSGKDSNVGIFRV